MEPSTVALPVVRQFTVRGIEAIDGSVAATVAPVRVTARIVRDGRSLPVPTETGSPSIVRVVGNATALFTLVMCIGLSCLALGPLVVGYRPVVVGSGSMEPSLKVADVVVVRDAGRDVSLGAVVDIRTDDGGRIHRVVEIVPDGYRTKGDANATPDSDIVASDNVAGIGVFLVPFVGLPKVWFDNGDWFKLVALVAGFVGAAYCSRADWLRSGRPAGSGAR